MTDIKIIFFDIDGTLISLDKDSISEKTKIALNSLKDKGIHICIATGRAPVQIPVFEGVDFDSFLSFNGSLCFNEKEEIFSNPLTNEDVLHFIENAKAMDKPLAMAGKKSYVADYFDDALSMYFGFSNHKPDFIDDLISFAQKTKIYQLNMPIRKEEYDRALLGTRGAKIAAWWDRAVDIIPKDGGKGLGVRKILEYYKIKKEEALAFGDGNNDLQMFEEVNGIAMANGSDDLKNISYDICKSVDCDGIFYYLKDKNII
ncbi:Cof-type HAD-IIB family hydrolase [Anaerococcus porci]|uniref:Cof-type HAD-IIB family hydrolase n=1 Tax=Anaerococcus porci TaxID=2652269 RepID=UPI002A75B840|nr:Cof-type HAD-IIB family hydrolase [Anaerococcus porci]MDY3007249.1 Cof-type HAD-IIB family hydrolase [Anaerococcus porci]